MTRPKPAKGNSLIKNILRKEHQRRAGRFYISPAMRRALVKSGIPREYIEFARERERSSRREIKKARSFADLDSMLNKSFAWLGEKDTMLRRTAVIHLGDLGRGNNKVANALVNALDDNDLIVRCNAAAGLAQIGVKNQKVKNRLMKMFDDKNVIARVYAADALGALGYIKIQKY